MPDHEQGGVRAERQRQRVDLDAGLEGPASQPDAVGRSAGPGGDECIGEVSPYRALVQGMHLAAQDLGVERVPDRDLDPPAAELGRHEAPSTQLLHGPRRGEERDETER